ncbi:BTB/POZ domain-containing protein-like isoform X2 [Iris pallida]|uniref:BTB/POZ domain-containing protein-like isoform X2 n=1 Tax=Iris pallida TaxID=29817 RepID=A0AAX6GM61_IRIPA|nr:BTB/POZ domain-containing protein-like isoform X2 [Iris pallida]
MTEEYAEGNLIAQAESFLDEVLGSWKDTVRALETCEEDGRVVPQAEDLHVVTRCISSLATKACADPSIFSWPMSARSSAKSSEDGGGVLWNGIRPAERPSRSSAAAATTSDWWYEDASLLSLPLYKRLITAMESKGMKPENIAGSLTFYARRHLPGLSRSATSFCGNAGRTNPASSESGQRSLLEEIVGLLPAKKGVASTKFLLRLLRTAMILHAGPSCRDSLEKRVGAQLEDAALEDLLIPNLGYSVETLYDVDCIQRILDHFLLTADQPSAAAAIATSPGVAVDEEEQPMTGSSSSSPSPTPMTMVAKLVDGYLAEVAPDVNLKLAKFQSLAAMIPDYARPLDDGIYRAIDISQVPSLAHRIRTGAALPAHELPEALPGGLHPRGPEREAAAEGRRPGPLLRAAPPADVDRRLVLRREPPWLLCPY